MTKGLPILEEHSQNQTIVQTGGMSCCSEWVENIALDGQMGGRLASQRLVPRYFQHLRISNKLGVPGLWVRGQLIFADC
jgi:hypothetical protein